MLAASLIGLFLGSFAVGTDGFMIAGLLPRISRDFHTSTSAAAQLVTVFAVGYALGAPVLASLLGRLERRALLACSLAVLAAANAAAGMTPALGLLFASRVAAALAAGAYSPTAAVVAARLVSAERRGRALSVITAGLTLSIIAGVPLGNLVGAQLGWRATFAGVAGLSAIVAVGLRVLLPRITGGEGASLRQRVAPIIRAEVRRVLAVTVLGILAGYLAYTYVASVSSAMGTTSSMLAIVLACFGAGAAIGSTLSGLGVDRYGQAPVVRTGAIIQTGALAALAAGDAASLRLGVAPAALAFALLGAGSWTYNAPQQHRLVELDPRGQTTVVALNSSAIYVGIGLSGILGAFLMSEGSPADGPALTCAVGTLLAITTATLAKRGHHEPKGAA